MRGLAWVLLVHVGGWFQGEGVGVGVVGACRRMVSG